MNMQGMHDINMVFADVPAKEPLEVLKNLTPFVFKGEDNEQNKDTIDTFLSKWGEIHQMRGTSDKKKPLHTCLSLEGKAYKWWMAFKPHKKPNMWASFERAFRNEFLPSDEKQRNWRAWDYCRQKYRTLNQYVSTYQDIILKLEGLDDFQKIQKHVLSKDSQTLEEAIKQAHVFNDPNEGDEASQRNTHPNTSNGNKNGNKNNNQKKRKFTNDAHTKGKKSKSTSRSPSKEDYERAQRENLCFMCLGNHNKKNCPKLTKAGPSQSKQVHMVQVLPFELSSRYSSVGCET